jgi:hypothetical protein
VINSREPTRVAAARDDGRGRSGGYANSHQCPFQ